MITSTYLPPHSKYPLEYASIFYVQKLLKVLQITTVWLFGANYRSEGQQIKFFVSILFTKLILISRVILILPISGNASSSGYLSDLSSQKQSILNAFFRVTPIIDDFALFILFATLFGCLTLIANTFEGLAALEHLLA